MDHLEEARKQAKDSVRVEDVEEATFCVHLANAHATIALVELLAERLPPPAETASECQKRLKEEKDGV